MPEWIMELLYGVFKPSPRRARPDDDDDDDEDDEDDEER